MIKLADISAIAAARPDGPALICSDYTLSWRSVEATVSNLVASLPAHVELGKVGQAVFLSRNRTEIILMMAAFATMGIPLCGIDYTLDADGLGDALHAVGADLAVVSSRHLTPTLRTTIQDHFGRSTIDLDDSLAHAVHLSTLTLPCRRDAGVPPTPRPTRIVAFTSGTSGSPKPTLRTAPTDLRRFGYFTRRYAFHADDRYLLNIPLYHVAGNGWARHFMGLGAAIVLVPVDNPHRMADAILTRRITATVTTPSNLAGVLSSLDQHEPSKPHALRFVLVGGKNFSPSDKARALEALGPVIHEYYGSTETGVNTIAEPEDLAFHPASVGRPYDGNRVVILDAHNAVLPVGRRGRIAVSSYLLMDRYMGASAAGVVIEGERFLITPDRGHLDEEGRLYVLNRASGVIGDFDIYSAEDALRTIDGVRDVAVMASSEELAILSADCALVVDPSVDRRRVLDEACAFLTGSGLSHRDVRIVSHIPYSPSGKVRSTALAGMMALKQREDTAVGEIA